MALISTFRRLIRVAAWATPYLQRWHREFNENRTQSERHMQAGNFGEAQKSWNGRWPTLSAAARR